MEHILIELKKIEEIKDIDELTMLYSFEQLQGLYKSVQELNILINHEFEKVLEIKLEKEKIKELWDRKNEVTQYYLLLLKALTAIERNKNLEQVEMITKKMKSILSDIQ